MNKEAFRAEVWNMIRSLANREGEIYDIFIAQMNGEQDVNSILAQMIAHFCAVVASVEPGRHQDDPPFMILGNWAHTAMEREREEFMESEFIRMMASMQAPLN